MPASPGKKFVWVAMTAVLGLSLILTFHWLHVLSSSHPAGENVNGKPLAAADNSGEKPLFPYWTQFGEKNYVEINVLAASEKCKLEIKQVVEYLGGTVVKGIDEEGLNLRVKVSGDAIGKLKDSPLVERVEPYKAPAFLNDRASGVIGARPLYAPGFVFPGGLTGAGQIVAVADSGLDIGVNSDKIHPDFRSQGDKPSKIVKLESVAGAPVPSDPVGHGTHVAGSVLGTGAASNGKFRGVAPEARLYFQSILNTKDQPDPPANLSELFNPAYMAGARIHVNSWGTPENSYTIISSQIDRFVRSHPDFLVVFGSGNSGAGANGKGTLVAEANSKNALVVGATENPRPGFGADSDNYSDVAEFSSRGPAADGRIKPDLVAPGTAIISACSSLVPSNFELNRNYTVLDGTSSAAALAAGSAALLREHFVSTDSNSSPSASLIKAALINGAVRLGKSRMQEGYGLIDIQGTVLALRNKTILYEDHKKGLEQGKFSEYFYQVEDSSRPLKITLSWTDPPAAPGTSGDTLVNDLDLIVTGPDGRVYYGNDFNGEGKADRLNNTEQVCVDNPLPGNYAIRVAGSNVKVDTEPEKPGICQDFAIVFGQPLGKGIIKSVAGNGKIILADNRVISPAPGASIHLAREGSSPDSSLTKFDLPAGADVYYSPVSNGITDLYVSYSIVFAESVKGYEQSGQKRLVELRPNYSEGGFNLSRSPSATLLVNGAPAGLIEEVLPGSDLVGIVNPGTGELWQGKAGYSLKTGRVAAVDPVARTVTLAEGETFRLSKLTSIKSENNWQRIPLYDSPFAKKVTENLQYLPEGGEVLMVMSPWTREVRLIYAENRVVSGKVVEIPRRGKVILDDGKEYDLPYDAVILKNGRKSGAYSLKQGDWVEGLLATGSDRELTRVEAYSGVLYGRVKEVKAEKNSLGVEGRNGMDFEFSLAKGITPFRGGKPVAPAGIVSGDAVRIAFNDSGEAVRLDAAALRVESIVIKEVSRRDGSVIIESDQGKKYALAPYSSVRKEGLRLAPEDLLADEKAVISSLQSTLTGTEVIFDLDAGSRPGAAVPELRLHLIPRSEAGKLTVKGSSSGNAVYVFLDGAEGVKPNLEKHGSFELDLHVKEAGSHDLTVAAVNRSSGGIHKISRKLYWRPLETGGADFAGTWAEKEIQSVLESGILQPDPDGAFNPGGAIAREAFAAALNRTIGGPPGSLINVSNRDVPVTRVEAVVLLWRAARMAGIDGEISGGNGPPFADWQAIPDWGRDAVLSAYSKGIVAGTPEGNFHPQRPLTRAEAAALLTRLGEYAGKQ